MSRARLGCIRPRSKGFTLVEVLVVIAIIALLVGLLIPAVQRARDMGRRTACVNTLRQVAIAMVSYEQAKGYFPFLKGISNTGSPVPCGQTVVSGTTSYAACSRYSTPQGNEQFNGGWMYMLPFLEELRLYDVMAQPFTNGSNQALPFGPIREYNWYTPYQAVIPAFRCPASPAGVTAAWTGYSGRRNYFMCIGDSIYNGVWANTAGGSRGVFGYSNTPVGKGIRVSQISDGTSKTILLGEKGCPSSLDDIRGLGAINQPSTNTNPSLCLSVATGRAMKYNAGINVIQPGWTYRTHTEMWHAGLGPFGAFNTVLPPNSPSCMNDGFGDQYGLFSASSYHDGGVNVAMADGSCRWINDNIDTGDLTKPEVTSGPSPYGVWGALGTRSGGNGEAANMD